MRNAGARVRILSVEDEILNRLLLRAVLQGSGDERLRGAELVEATTLAEARELMLNAEPDIVLVDRRLPDGDGFELARELRAAQTTVQPPIVALTADAVPQTQIAAASAGCTAMVIKPYRPAELVELIGRLLDGRVEPGMAGTLGTP